MQHTGKLDVVIVGGGIGGVIALKYAVDSGLDAVLLERRERVGGLWRDLPAWQDIQFRKEDWTLGDLPIDGEDQASILRNIEAWVERFQLAPFIKTDAEVASARPCQDGWVVTTRGGAYRSRYLIAATGGHNRPVVPEIERSGSRVRECHSSELRDPRELAGRRVVVVGGGASAFDLVDLGFANGAACVTWVYRSLKWMRPTRRSKYAGTDMRLLARQQMIGTPIGTINRLLNKDLASRYEKAGMRDILPRAAFDIETDQLVPGRPGMIRNFARIARHCGEVRAVRGNLVELTDGARVQADLVLWGTGYSTDLSYLAMPGLSQLTDLRQAAKHCRSIFRSAHDGRLFLLAPGVLETNTSTPWAYAHAARSIASHIKGRANLDASPKFKMTNHFDLAKALARVDRANYPFALWYLRYLCLAMFQPRSKPMPVP